MIEKLMNYLAELEATALEVRTHDYNAEIMEKVTAYERELRAECATHKATELAKIDSDIDCIKTLIKREQAAQRCSDTTLTTSPVLR